MSGLDCRIRYARDLSRWLVSEFATRRHTAPGTAASDILAPLTELRIGAGTERSGLSSAARQVASEPYLLETSVYILRRQGLWPSDPGIALRCYGEILSVLLELAPAFGVPWQMTAKALSGPGSSTGAVRATIERRPEPARRRAGPASEGTVEGAGLGVAEQEGHLPDRQIALPQQ